VDIHADAVAETMNEAIAHAGGLDDAAGGGVDRLARDARPNDGHRRGLGISHGAVGALDVIGDAIDGESAGHVAEITLASANEIDDDGVSVTETAQAGGLVRDRGTFAALDQVAEWSQARSFQWADDFDLQLDLGDARAETLGNERIYLADILASG